MVGGCWGVAADHDPFLWPVALASRYESGVVADLRPDAGTLF